MFIARTRLLLAKLLIVVFVFATVYTLLFLKYHGLSIQSHYGLDMKDADSVQSSVDTPASSNPTEIKQACVHPRLQMWHPVLKKYFQVTEPLLECAQDENWVTCKDGKIFISDDAIKKHGHIKCDYEPHFRENNDFHTISGKIVRGIKSGTLLKSDFFNVKCTATDGKPYDNVQASVAFDKKVHERLKSTNVPKNALGMNVLMYGLDSISRMTYMRNLPKTHAYFTKQLGGVVLEGYNIVGDGTPQALLPILCGKTELELPEARRGHKGAMPVNGHPWIWKDFAKAGYATQFNEDETSIGAFTYRMLGFKEQPTDHYMRAFYRKAESQFSKHKYLCLGSNPRHVVVMNYIRDFLDMYKAKPKFSFTFMSELSHGSNTKVKVGDEDLVQFLKALNNSNHLDNTMLILMSDHGARFKDVRQVIQGKYEERMPYFGIMMPSWFKMKHPDAHRNLLTNAHRLSSPFDIHATFRHMLYYDGSKLGDIAKRGISLFDEIPLERTCKHTDIENHWCACLNWQNASIADPNVQEAAMALLSAINNLTKSERALCEELKLKEIKHASKFVPQPNMVKFKQAKDVDGFVPDLTDKMVVDEVFYQVTMVTSPGNALYEGTIRFGKHPSYISEHDISRINMYGNQPHCVAPRLPYLRKYCYCKKQLS